MKNGGCKSCHKNDLFPFHMSLCKINVVLIYRQGHKHHYSYDLFLNHILRNVPLQGKDKHITRRQIEERVDSEITTTHNSRTGKKQIDDFIKLSRVPSPLHLQNPFLLFVHNDESTNIIQKGGI